MAPGSRDEYLAGYRWALEHLTDPGVLRDAALYAEGRGNRAGGDLAGAPTPAVEDRRDGSSDQAAPPGSTKAGQDFARLPFRPGQRVRVTFEAEIIKVSPASGNRGTAVIYTRAGAGMNDGIWLVREPNFGEVISVEIVGDPDGT